MTSYLPSLGRAFILLVGTGRRDDSASGGAGAAEPPVKRYQWAVERLGQRHRLAPKFCTTCYVSSTSIGIRSTGRIAAGAGGL